MNVEELIERLKSEDPKMRVVIQGYEQGYDEVKIVEHVKITPNTQEDKPWWDGEFNESRSEESEIALFFPRGS
jgi:hypothetical protein